MISDWMPEIGVIVIILSAVAFAASRMLVLRIQEHEVGIVIKKWGNTSLPAHRLVALHGEAGLQAETLAPGRHWFYWSPKYKVLKVPTVWVPPGEIALVIAEDGDRLPEGQLLGTVIECDQFQDARTFLLRGGQKGRQRAVLTTGRYRVNTALFRVVTSGTATDYGLKPDDLWVYTVSADSIGIVTTSEGASLPPGDIAGPPIAGHEDFQNIQKFIEGGGYKGLQEAFLTAGAWNLNPWFVTLEHPAISRQASDQYESHACGNRPHAPNHARLVQRQHKTRKQLRRPASCTRTAVQRRLRYRDCRDAGHPHRRHGRS